MKKLSYSFLAFLVFLTFPLAVYAQSGAGGGSFSLAFMDYAVQGQLVNANINPDSTVSATMIINDNVQTSIGGIPINARGEWSGTVNGTSLSGTIQDVQGTIKVCFIWCGEADYTGQGTWIGTLSGSQGTGTFQGTVTFVHSSIPKFIYTLNQHYPISGNWTSRFSGQVNATTPGYVALQAEYRMLQQRMNQIQTQNQQLQTTITQQSAMISQLNQQLTSANTSAQRYEGVAAVLAVIAVGLAAFNVYQISRRKMKDKADTTQPH